MEGRANGAPHFFFLFFLSPLSGLQFSNGCCTRLEGVCLAEHLAPACKRSLLRLPPRRAFSSYNKLWAQVASPQKRTPPIPAKKCASAISPPWMYWQSRLAEYDENRRHERKQTRIACQRLKVNLKEMFSLNIKPNHNLWMQKKKC